MPPYANTCDVVIKKKPIVFEKGMLKVWEILTSAVTSGRPQDQHTEGVENRGKSYKKESHNLCPVPSS